MISAIVITRNEEHNITRTLKSLGSPLITEIIVSDSNSSDETSERVHQMSEHDKRIKFHTFNEAPFTASRGRVEGVAQLEHACNEFLLFLDGDMEFDGSFLERGLEVLEKDANIAWVSGQMDNYFYNDLDKVVRIEKDVYDLTRQNVGGGALMRKSIYIASEGFNPELVVNEESELEYRMNKVGGYAKRLNHRMFIHHTETPTSKRRIKERLFDGKLNALSKNIKVAFTDFGYLPVLIKHNQGFFIALMSVAVLPLISLFFGGEVSLAIAVLTYTFTVVFHNSFRIATNYVIYAIFFYIFIFLNFLKVFVSILGFRKKT